MTISAGSFFVFGFFAGLFSPVGIIGIIATLMWAIVKAIRMSKDDRGKFFNFSLNATQGVTIGVLTVLLGLFAMFMLL